MCHKTTQNSKSKGIEMKGLWLLHREGRGIPCLYNNVPSSLNSKPVVPIYYFRRGGGGSGSNKYFNISSRSFKMHTAHTVLGMRGISRMKSLYFFFSTATNHKIVNDIRYRLSKMKHICIRTHITSNP